jgi:hypothetical protein
VNNFVIRHRKIINLQMLIILLAVILGGPQVADGQGVHTNLVTIKKENTSIHGSFINVSGTCDIRDGSNIWVLYHRKRSDSSWMVKPATECSRQEWASSINLGNQSGTIDIDIIAVTFSAQTREDDIGRLLTGINGDQLPRILRGETSDRAITTVTVRKVR